LKNIFKIAEDSPSQEFKTIGERVQKGELRWLYYAIEGNKGYHFYTIIK
jgi:hypothetical protein